MSATLTLLITEIAQRKALIAGQPAQREQTYQIPPSEITRLLDLPWTTIGIDGSASCKIPEVYRYSESELDNAGLALTSWNLNYGYGRIELPVDERPADPETALMVAEALHARVIREMTLKRAQRLDERNERQRARDAEIAARCALAQGLLDGYPDTWIVDGKVRPVPTLDGVPEALAKHVRESHASAEKLLAAQREAEIERAEAEPRAWCAEYGAALSLPLNRAAREGRRVRAELTKLVLARVEQKIIKIGEIINRAGCGEIATSYADQIREDVPSELAYVVLDACTDARGAIAEAAVIPGVQVEIGPIARHDVAEHGSAQWRTGVEITVSHPWLDHGIGFVMLAEPLCQDDE